MLDFTRFSNFRGERMMRLAAVCIFIVGSYFAPGSLLLADTIAGHWIGTATVHGQQVPVELDLSPVSGQESIGKEA